LYQRIQEANARLEALDQLKDEFVSLASHELRTPMTAISSYIWMMLDGEVGTINEKQKVYLQNAYTSTKRLIALVNDMLNVSRIESGRMILKQDPMDLEQITQQTLTEIMPTAQIQGITLTIEKPANPLPKVLADENKIKEVIMNLVGNSLKFTPSGGKITISFAEKDNLVETYVIDNGRGIKAEDVPKLFKKFGMIEGNYLKTTPGQGTGLGLYIAKSIVELHGGTVSFHSEGENKGATFSFTLKKA
jgi:signal transduction histidine kinase